VPHDLHLAVNASGGRDVRQTIADVLHSDALAGGGLCQKHSAVRAAPNETQQTVRAHPAHVGVELLLRGTQSFRGLRRPLPRLSSPDAA